LVDHYENPVAKEIADEHVRISSLDKEKVLEFARLIKPELVISTAVDQANLTACYVSEKLNLPAPYSYQTARNVTDKVLMKKKMEACCIPTARFIYLENIKETGWCDLGFPLVVKPADNCGSKGVFKVGDISLLHSYLNIAFEFSRTKRVIIEEYKEGREICADCFLQEGEIHIISIYEKFNIYSPATVIQCFRSIRPVGISPGAEKEIQKIVRQIASAFNLKNTSLFVQTIVNEDTVNVIEFGARAAGGLAYKATELATGFDAINATVDSFLHIPAHIAFKNPEFYYSTNSIYGRPAVFGRITGHEELLDKGVIETFSCYKTKGMELTSHMSSSDRVGGFIVKAKSKGALFEKTETAMKELEIYDINNRPVMIKPMFEKVTDHHLIL